MPLFYYFKPLFSSSKYAQRRVMINGKRVSILMHRVILGITDPKIYSDHKDGDRLNNQRSNLREATIFQNMQNKKKQSNTTCIYKGVFYCKRDKAWIARISKNGVLKRCGNHKTAKEAALAYNKAALQLHGEFARLNEIE